MISATAQFIHSVQVVDPRAALRARLAASKLVEAIHYSQRKGAELTDRQRSETIEIARNMGRIVWQFSRAAMRQPAPAPKAFTCPRCHFEQDIDRGCIVCGTTVAETAKAAA